MTNQDTVSARLAGVLGGFLIAAALFGLRNDLGHSIMASQTSMVWGLLEIRVVVVRALQMSLGVLLLRGVHLRSVYLVILLGACLGLVPIGFNFVSAFTWRSGTEIDEVVRASSLVGVAFDAVSVGTVATLASVQLRRNRKTA